MFREEYGSIWELARRDYEAVVVFTNGYVKKDGTAVMGRGIAREAAVRWPSLPGLLGAGLKHRGNHVLTFTLSDLDSPMALENAEPREWNIITFPTKHAWWEQSDMTLIERSAQELVVEADILEVRRVIMGRPGCGNGNLAWRDVRPLLEGVLDDRFTVVTWGVDGGDVHG